MNGEPCDDGKVCTEGSRCTGGACVGGTDPCDDGDPCTRDSCSEAEGCAHERAAPPCGDGVCSDSCGEDAAACFEDCGPKPEGFVLVPHGELLMGSPDEEPGRHGDEGPQRLVKITRGFWMKATEVTQGEWKALVGADKNPSKYPSCGEDCALDRVNWWEALAYCNALSVREELPECYSLTGCDEKAPGEGMECAGVTVSAEGENPVLCEGYRLPTEAEWEHAARAGSSSVGFDGPLTVDPGSCELDAALDAVAWYCGNSEVSYEGAGDCSSAGGTASCGPHPVGEKQPNGWGLHDMLGNQSEWVWDTYDAGYYEGRPDPDADPTGPAPGDERVVRGGAWGSVAGSCRAASRKPASPGLRDRFRGFRPVRTGEPLLVVTPAEELDFGTVGEGQRVERVVKLANAGAAPLDVHELRIEDDASDELRFGLLEGWPYLGQALSVAVSEEIEVGIVFENKVGPAGSAQATLRVVSDATPSPGYPLLLSARRAPGPECDARLAPSRLDFGTIPFGTVRDMGFTLTNVGTGDCEILGLDDADRLRVDDCSLGFPGFPNPFGTCIRGEGAGSQSSLRFGVLEPPAPATVEPGKSVTISVRYTAPAGPGLFTGVEGLDTNNALLSMKLRDTHRNEDVWVPAAAANAASPGQANLQARAAAAEVAAIPHEVEFGATTPGCSSRAVTVKLYNKGAAPLSVSGIKLGEDCTGEIELVSTPSLPAELLRGSPLSVELRYVPTDPGRDLWCALEVRSNHPSSPELAIPISGRGSDGNAQVDSFTGLSGRHVDMLLVVDTSGSMTREQGELAAKVADLVVESVAWGNHYRIAVTTADVDEHEGRFFGSPRWVAPDTPDGLETLAASIAALPQSQGGIEQGFDAVHRALTPPHSSLPGDPPLPCADESACRAPYGCYADPEDYSAEPGSFCGGPNWGFLRRDAALEVVILSDEADQSAAGLDFYRDFFSELKGPREELLRVHAIVGTDGQTAQACGVDPDDADAGAGYVEIANETGGVLGSICEEDYGDTLRAISALVFGPKTRFVLSREARPGSVEVKVNGSACEAGWILDEPSSSVVFEEDHPCLPQAGDSVEISYEAICVPVE